MSPWMRPAHPCGPAALRLRFSGWLRRATLALTLFPLVAGAVVYTTDADLAAALQAFGIKVVLEPVRICCNAEVGGAVIRIDCPLDDIGGATERSPTDSALGKDGKFSVADSGVGTTNHIAIELIGEVEEALDRTVRHAQMFPRWQTAVARGVASRARASATVRTSPWE